VARSSRRSNNPGLKTSRTDGKLHEVRNPRRVGSLLGDKPGSRQGKTLKFREAPRFGAEWNKDKRGEGWKHSSRPGEGEP
jgi:hypothetical protein